MFIGTSSWKYQGRWNQLYTPSRYEYRGKIATARFERSCLAEYAEVFKTVCLDAAYYAFPSEKYLDGLAAQVSSDFQFGFKVTDEITVRKFPNLPRFGIRAGKPNENFLNADLISRAFLGPCEHIRANVGIVMFEFFRFFKCDYEHGRDFVADLDKFFGNLPKGWPYAVEMRNNHWLAPDYFTCLPRHSITHVFNSWDAMRLVVEQMTLPGSRTNPELVAAPFLLKPGVSGRRRPDRSYRNTFREFRRCESASIGANRPPSGSRLSADQCYAWRDECEHSIPRDPVGSCREQQNGLQASSRLPSPRVCPRASL